MKKNKKNIIISCILLFVSIIYTLLVKFIDVRAVGVNNSEIGFSSINKFIFEFLGTNNIWYFITEILGVVAVFIAMIYALIGLVQLIKRKSLFKIDKEIIGLGIFYIVVLVVYVLFEKVIINYRPILVEGMLEASYPSSHTMLSLCICCSAIMINKSLFNNFKHISIFNILLLVCSFIIVVGRLLSGVHWFTDIIGGVLISCFLLMSFYTYICFIKKK